MSKVLVVTPSYNHAKWIEDCITSVLNQTFKDFHYVIYDDCSTDNTQEILKKYSHELNIEVILGDVNRGHSKISEIINDHSSKFVAICNSDDFWAPDFLEIMLNEMDTSIGVVHCNGFYTNEKGEKLSLMKTGPSLNYSRRIDFLDSLLLRKDWIVPIGCLYRRECLIDFKWDEKYPAMGELIHLLIAERYSYKYCDESLVYMRQHGSNEGRNHIKQFYNLLAWYIEYFDQRGYLSQLYRDKVISSMAYTKFRAFVLENRKPEIGISAKVALNDSLQLKRRLIIYYLLLRQTIRLGK